MTQNIDTEDIVSSLISGINLNEIPLDESETNAPSQTSVLESEANEREDEIIKSPLDQRVYKAITLPNGLRAMLISTYDVPPLPEEQDATKVPCQIPEVAEFNKTFLGYDNPAARVKCACPCDEKKACCCTSMRPEANANSEKAQCRTTLNTRESMKAACCSKKAREYGDDAAMDEAASTSFPSKTSLRGNDLKGKSENFEAYVAEVFKELRRREMALKDKRFKTKARNELKTTETDEIYRTPSNSSVRVDSLSQEYIKDSFSKRLRNTHLRHYPHPPQYSEGVHTNRPNPIETSRTRSTRPSFTDDISPDLEGSVYLVIGSGYFDDPEETPGLAHFCEHAVFLGSNKFPEPNQLFKLVLPYNGYVNAFTTGLSTTFCATANFALFPLAVEILGDMVGFPLFPNALVAAELEALDAEYSLRQDDMPKYFQLIGSLAKKGHVMRKMDSGNINTLTVPNFYRKLMEWRKIYYSPNRMTVAVEAPFPLDFLENLVIESFGKIPIPHAAPIPLMTNRHLLSNGPFDMKRFHQIYQVPSVYHSEFIALHWGFDAKAWKNLRVKPLEYLGAIVSHKADGGLWHYLCTQGLATNVDAGCWESDVTRNHYTSVFSISVDMTEKGFKRQDNILQAIFGYIQMLIKKGPQKSFFHELQKQQLDAFHYRAAEPFMTVAEQVSRWMQFIPAQWSLISPALTPEFDEKIIQRYTESLTIENANVIIFSKNYRGLERTSFEEYYNTPYAAYSFPNALKEKIKKTKEEYSRNFTVPIPNPLLLNTCCSRAREKDLLKKGSLLKIKGKLSVSFVSRKVRLVTGLLPFARYSVWIGSPLCSYVGAQEGSSTKLLLFSQYFNEILESRFYHFSAADIQMETEVSQGELHIVVSGPSTMLPSVMEQILDIFKDFESIADPTGFDVIKSSFLEWLDNTILDNRFLAWDLFYYLWTNNHDLIFDHKRNTERLSFTTFIGFVKAFKAKMFIQSHLYGYCTKAQGQTVVNALAKLEYEPIEMRQYLMYRCLKLPVGERIIRVISQNPSVHTSVVINSYQFGALTEAEEEAVNFIAKTMSDSAFYQLRTEQQLGYIIIIYPEMTYGVSSVIVELVTQPKNFSTDYCNQCIDNFLQDFYSENLATPETFAEFCLGKPKLEMPFHAIKNLYAAHLLPNPNSYRKLSIQVIGEAQDSTESGQKNSGPTEKTGQSQSIFRKVSQSQIDYEQIKPTDVRGTTGRLSTIDEVRAAKKSLQVRALARQRREDFLKKEKMISSKVVTHLHKFKQSLIFYPNLKSKNL